MNIKYCLAKRHSWFAVLVLCWVTMLVFTIPASAQDIQAAEASVGPAAVLVPGNLQEALAYAAGGEDTPLGYEVDLERLQELKRQPFKLSEEEQPAVEEDLSAFGIVSPPLAPSLLTDFEGRDDYNQPDGYLHTPPDPTLAVGPSHVGTVVNTTLNFYTKAGTLALEASLDSWFSDVNPPGGLFDPKIAYDHHEGRWLVLAIASDFNSLSSYLLSVSQSSDPTGGWWNYKLDGTTTTGGDAWADYPDLGFDADTAVYITSNQFTFSGSSFTTSLLNVLPKSALYSGAGFSYYKHTSLQNSDNSMAFTLRPAHTFGNPGKEFMVNSKSGGWSNVTLWNVVPSFPPTPSTITRQATIGIGSYSPPPDARQLGCESTLDTIDNRIYNAMYRDSHLYCAFTESYDWGSGTVAAMRYLKLDTLSNTAALNVRYGADGLYYWFPAIYTDGSGNIVIVFARSGETEYAGIWYTGRLTTDPSTQSSALLKGGETCITGSRWGDYFGIGLDPADNGKVWIYGEWAKDIPSVNSDWDWGTWIGRIAFGTDLSLSLVPDSTTISRPGILRYTVTATNNTAVSQNFEYWTNVNLPSGSLYPPSRALSGPYSVTLGAFGSRSAHFTHWIPRYAPLGTYTFNAYAGTYPDTIEAEDHFDFAVMP